MKITKLLLVMLFSIAVGACGGGGGSPSSTNPPVTSTLSFPLQSGYRAMVAAGYATNYTIAGTCSGTESDVRSTPVAGTFEGVAALGVTSTTTVNYTQCSASSGTATSTVYYDTNYANVGMSSANQYAVLASTPVIPTSVKVGDTGTYGSANIYANSSKATLQGRFVLSYAIEPDTANTAIVVFITKRYDSSSVLLWTEQDKKRIASNGTLTPVSIDRQSNVSADHLILTAATGNNSGGGSTGTGVTFSRFIGYNSIRNTHINSVGVYVAGAETVRAGAEYSWNNAFNPSDAFIPSARLYFWPSSPLVPSMGDKIQLLFSSGHQVICFVSPPAPSGNYPLCSSVGTTFDKTAGVITLSSTPLLALFTPTNITATGSLTFAPF